MGPWRGHRAWRASRRDILSAPQAAQRESEPVRSVYPRGAATDTNRARRQGVFKGWQMLCVMLVTFPPSKNFETYLQGFIERHLALAEGRIDVMAKYCLRRLPIIARKGPKGKAPSVGEIESASVRPSRAFLGCVY